eukprot:scaffold9508_cov169-Skeletonema_menzelii.AAC.9
MEGREYCCRPVFRSSSFAVKWGPSACCVAFGSINVTPLHRCRHERVCFHHAVVPISIIGCIIIDHRPSLDSPSAHVEWITIDSLLRNTLHCLKIVLFFTHQINISPHLSSISLSHHNNPNYVNSHNNHRTSLNLKQDFLEYTPYHDHSQVKVNTYKNKAPFTGKVVSTKRIVGPQATGETCHIIIDHNGDFPYIEGQSWGVIPPGTREKDGKPHAVRLYSIASSRYGDDMTGKTGSLCVRRATYWCPELKADDPAKKGICSNFLCDTNPGDEIMMTGPAGKVMLMPEEDPTTDYIMVATGTGIAPFRGFVRRLFAEDTPAANVYKGQAWLFLGVANSDALLYDDEFQLAKEQFPENFRLDYALSREQENKNGGKMYIQDKVEEYADEIFAKLENGAHMYFCGLKGMMPGIQDMLKGVCESKGIDYDEFIKGLKKSGQWHVEVY